MSKQALDCAKITGTAAGAPIMNEPGLLPRRQAMGRSLQSTIASPYCGVMLEGFSPDSANASFANARSPTAPGAGQAYGKFRRRDPRDLA